MIKLSEEEIDHIFENIEIELANKKLGILACHIRDIVLLFKDRSFKVSHIQETLKLANIKINAKVPVNRISNILHHLAKEGIIECIDKSRGRKGNTYKLKQYMVYKS